MEEGVSSHKFNLELVTNNCKAMCKNFTKKSPTIAPVVLARIGAMDLVALCLKSSMEATVR